MPIIIGEINLNQNYKRLALFACEECKFLMASEPNIDFSASQCPDCQILTGKKFHKMPVA
jgi:hypothetical protein